GAMTAEIDGDRRKARAKRRHLVEPCAVVAPEAMHEHHRHRPGAPWLRVVQQLLEQLHVSHAHVRHRSATSKPEIRTQGGPCRQPLSPAPFPWPAIVAKDYEGDLKLRIRSCRR